MNLGSGHLVISVAVTASLVGCNATSRSTGVALETQQSTQRNPLEAQRLTLEAAELMQTDPDRAETMLREAIAADLFHGPAHNNLGILHLARDEIYEAAGEFEWARKLMPGHPDPRVNLGLALERAGRVRDAINAYEAAIEIYPGHIPATQALARAQIRHGLAGPETASLLGDIAMRGDSERWRAWARVQQIQLAD